MYRPAPCPTPASAWRPRPHLLAALGAIAASLLLGACGGSSSSPAGASAPSAADNALRFSRCMREHGVKNFPNPQTTAGGGTRLTFRARAGGPASVDPQTLEAAQNACKRYSPAEQVHLTPQEKVQREEAVLKFAKCMREHGIDVHASTVGGGVRIGIHRGPGSGGPNPESPAFQTAQKDCQGLLPFKRGGPGGGPRTGAVEGGKGGGGGGLAIGG